MRLLVAALAVLLALPAFAEEAPGLGLVYNTRENSSLTYECRKTSASIVDCDFTQVSVRKEAKPEDLAEVLLKGRASYEDEKKQALRQCADVGVIIDILEGRKPAPDREKFGKLTVAEKNDALTAIRTMAQYCKAPTEENYLNLLKVGHEKETRTCRVSTNTFKHTFRRIQDVGTKNAIWVVQSSPTGPCGIVQLSRFESEDSKVGSASLTFWKFSARKAITNPNAEFYPGMACSQLDQEEYLYDWRSREIQVGCDYIKFSPL